MRKFLVTAGIVALLAPAAALAEDPAGQPAEPGKSPAQWCQAERDKMGTEAFKLLYGTKHNRSNAFGKCVSKKAQEEKLDGQNAAKTCRTEQSDPNFAAAHDGKSFQQFYGTGKKGANAFGKCVSTKAKAAAQESHAKTVKAAKECKAERAKDPAEFKKTHGTNPSKSNAFGKCVSKKTKTK